MNNNDDKKSAGLWAHRLFFKAGTSIALPQSKTYFAHRYHNNHAELDRNPFSALFSGSDKEQASLVSDTANSHRFFEQASPLSKGNTFTVESSQAFDSNQVKNPGNNFNCASYTALYGQFTVLNCYDENPDTKTFRLGIPNGRTFDYLPGQYITLSIVISGQEYKRSYSLASSPTRPKNLEITIKRAPNGGLVSNWLNDHLKIGDTVNLKGPFGNFSCLKQTCEKILFLAAGSGIVPIMSMLRWLADTDARIDVRLLLSFRSPDDIIYRDELKLIAARHKNINIAITLTTDAIVRSQWSGLTGRVNEKMIHELVPDLPERMVFLCGPDDFMSACKKNLLKLQLPDEKLICESYIVNSPLTRPKDSGLGQPWRKKLGAYRIDFAKSGKTIIADGQMTLLELAEKSNIIINHECRSGNCGECMIKCLKGRIEMTDEAEIDDLNRKKGWVYACCAYPVSNVVLDI